MKEKLMKLAMVVGIVALLIWVGLMPTVTKADNPANQPVVTQVIPVTLCVSLTAVDNWDGSFGSVEQGTVSTPHAVVVTNCSNVAMVLTVTGVTNEQGTFYQTCLQVSTDCTNWVNVGTGWQMGMAAQTPYALYFRVNVPPTAGLAVYSGNINFIVSLP